MYLFYWIYSSPSPLSSGLRGSQGEKFLALNTIFMHPAATVLVIQFFLDSMPFHFSGSCWTAFILKCVFQKELGLILLALK